MNTNCVPNIMILAQVVSYSLYAKYHEPNPNGLLDILLTRVHKFTMHKSEKGDNSANYLQKYSSVFRENRCPPPPKPVYGSNFSHEVVTLKVRSRSPKSNKLLILSDLYRLANLVTFHPMVHEITCRKTLFGLILVDYVWQWPRKLDKGHQNLFSFLSCPNVISMQICLKAASWFTRHCAQKHLLAQIWQFKSRSDIEK